MYFIAIVKAFGHILEDVLGRKTPNNPQYLTYLENGRQGYIYYNEGGTRIPFYYEFGGGDCQLCIDIPNETKWENETHTPFWKRDAILHFVGKTLLRERYTFGRLYEIDRNCLYIY